MSEVTEHPEPAVATNTVMDLGFLQMDKIEPRSGRVLETWLFEAGAVYFGSLSVPEEPPSPARKPDGFLVRRSRTHEGPAGPIPMEVTAKIYVTRRGARLSIATLVQALGQVGFVARDLPTLEL